MNADKTNMDKEMKTNQICMIISYFGREPKWFNLYLYSCSKQDNVDFYGDVDAISNAVVRVLSNDNLRVSLAKAGVETARSFDWAPAVKQFERVLGL